MQKKTGDFSIEEAMRLAKSPAGQQLLEALRQTDVNALNKAAAQAGSGEVEQAKQTLSALLDSPEIKALLQQFGR